MPYVTVGRENSGEIELYYEDHGQGDAVLLVHGWPLSSASWEKQVPALLEAGHRVVAYDRRGFGDSSRPATGYDYDTLAADMEVLMEHLDLEDVTLVGFSMGGGELARYLGEHGAGRASAAVFVSAIPPALLKSPDNPEGVDASVFDGMKQAIASDRPAFLAKFFSDFYNFDDLGGDRVSDEVLDGSWNVAMRASPIGTITCVSSWLRDFREDVKRIEVPTLVIHGASDRIVPIGASGARMPDLVPDCRLTTIEDAPHALIWTHADEANRALLGFLAEARGEPVRRAA